MNITPIFVSTSLCIGLQVEVLLSCSQSFVQNNTTIEVEGVLEIGSHRDGDTGFISQLRLRDARFRTL